MSCFATSSLLWDVALRYRVTETVRWYQLYGPKCERTEDLSREYIWKIGFDGDPNIYIYIYIYLLTLGGGVSYSLMPRTSF